MRLWTLHPGYLDVRGLVALWREALLAQQVLLGKTVGYRNHPQLLRFTEQPDPVTVMAAYLQAVYEEARCRGYRFDASKITPHQPPPQLITTTGQLAYEWAHLRAKLLRRDPVTAARWVTVVLPDPHPLFKVVEGSVAVWERPIEYE